MSPACFFNNHCFNLRFWFFYQVMPNIIPRCLHLPSVCQSIQDIYVNCIYTWPCAGHTGSENLDFKVFLFSNTPQTHDVICINFSCYKPDISPTYIIRRYRSVAIFFFEVSHINLFFRLKLEIKYFCDPLRFPVGPSTFY